MLVIFSKPTIAPADRAWIDRVRQAHDPQYELIALHFTFVFPFSDIAADTVQAHMRAVAETTPRIRFRLTRVAVVQDSFGTGCHLFLVPADGEAAMRTLHAQLYADVLAPKLHPTIPFLPHVTIGAFADSAEAERTAAALGSVDIGGTLDALILAEFDGKTVAEIHSIGLA